MNKAEPSHLSTNSNQPYETTLDFCLSQTESRLSSLMPLHEAFSKLGEVSRCKPEIKPEGRSALNLHSKMHIEAKENKENMVMEEPQASEYSLGQESAYFPQKHPSVCLYTQPNTENSQSAAGLLAKISKLETMYNQLQEKHTRICSCLYEEVQRQEKVNNILRDEITLLRKEAMTCEDSLKTIMQGMSVVEPKQSVSTAKNSFRRSFKSPMSPRMTRHLVEGRRSRGKENSPTRVSDMFSSSAKNSVKLSSMRGASPTRIFAQPEETQIQSQRQSQPQVELQRLYQPQFEQRYSQPQLTVDISPRNFNLPRPDRKGSPLPSPRASTPSCNLDYYDMYDMPCPFREANQNMPNTNKTTSPKHENQKKRVTETLKKVK